MNEYEKITEELITNKLLMIGYNNKFIMLQDKCIYAISEVPNRAFNRFNGFKLGSSIPSDAKDSHAME